MAREEDDSKVFPGIYRGTVASNKDPEKLRRLKMYVPVVLGDTMTDWAWGVDSSAAIFEPPEVGQGVWVMFENGNPSHPVWVGTFGKHKADKYQTNTRALPAGSYPETIVFNGTPENVDILSSLVSIAERLEALIDDYASHSPSAESHPPGFTSPAPTDLS